MRTHTHTLPTCQPTYLPIYEPHVCLLFWFSSFGFLSHFLFFTSSLFSVQVCLSSLPLYCEHTWTLSVCLSAGMLACVRVCITGREKWRRETDKQQAGRQAYQIFPPSSSFLYTVNIDLMWLLYKWERERRAYVCTCHRVNVSVNSCFFSEGLSVCKMADLGGDI